MCWPYCACGGSVLCVLALLCVWRPRTIGRRRTVWLLCGGSVLCSARPTLCGDSVWVSGTTTVSAHIVCAPALHCVARPTLCGATVLCDRHLHCVALLHCVAPLYWCDGRLHCVVTLYCVPPKRGDAVLCDGRLLWRHCTVCTVWQLCSVQCAYVDRPNQNWGCFVIRAWRSSTSRRGCFAVLIWRSEQSRSGGELPLSAMVCPFAAWPSFQWPAAYWAGGARSVLDHGRLAGGRAAFSVLPFQLTVLPCFGNTIMFW